MNPRWIIPVGTKVVVREALAARGGVGAQPAGAVGVIVKSPLDQSHSYRVRFTDGTETPLSRNEFVLLKELQAVATRPATDALHDFDLYSCVIYRCIVGSRAYGLDDDDSDTDRRGIYLPPAEVHWSLFGVPEQLENPETEEAYWELQKFIVLALKGNPNVLECLYTPLVEFATPLAEELRGMRARFLSRIIYQTYNGYVLSQFKKINADFARDGKVKQKHAMHLIRLLLAGIAALETGELPVRVEEHRERLLEIKTGQIGWAEVDAWRLKLHGEFDAAYGRTKLPERPDYDAANEFLIRARRSEVTHRPRGTHADATAVGMAPDDADATIPRRLLNEITSEHAYPLVFATISGAHLYGFASPDSDFDLRGVHVLSLRDVVGLSIENETVEWSGVREGREIDLVTHDARKFFTLLLKRNGYVLEQLFSPLIVKTTPEHAELKKIAAGCITRHHSHHYLGFFETQWRLFDKDRRVKPLLYAYRVLLTGIHLMRTGQVQANLAELNAEFRFAWVDELIARKRGGAENQIIEDADLAFHEGETRRLVSELEAASVASALPEAPIAAARSGLNDLLLRIRGVG